MVPMKARLLSLLHRWVRTDQATQDTTPDPAVTDRLRALVVAGHTVDYVIDAAHAMRVARTANADR
jgi:hypothetical protein